MATAHLRSLVLVSSLIASVALASARETPPAKGTPARHLTIASRKIAVKDATTPMDLMFISNPNAPFTVTLDTEDHRGGYVEGERFKVVVTASADCYVTVLSWGTEGDIVQVAPAKATTGSDEPIFLKTGESLAVPKGAAAFKAQPPHGETNLRVIATLKPLMLDIPKAGAAPEQSPPKEEEPSKESSRERFRKLLLGDKARGGSKGIGVDEAPPSPLDGKDWTVADIWVMTGSTKKDLAERMGVSEDAAVKPREEFSEPAQGLDAIELPDEPATPRERPARKNPLGTLTPNQGETASEDYRQRWARLVAGQSATKAIGPRFVPARPLDARTMPRIDAAGEQNASAAPMDLLVVRSAPKGSKAIGGRGYSTEKVPLALPGSKAIGTPDALLRKRIEDLRAKDPSIRTVIPNRQWQVFGAAPQQPKDESIFRGLQWHLTNEAAKGHDIRWFLAAVDLIDVKPALIGMVDQGIHLNEARLKPYVAVNAGETPDNGIDDDGNGHVDDYYGWNFASNSATLSSADDAFNHGSYCSSIIAGGPVKTPGYFFPVAYDPSLVISACVAWDEKAGTAIGSVDATIQAIQYAADRGAKVMNLSLGGPSTKLELLLLSGHPIFDELEKKNVLLVIAAGNENKDIDVHPVSPACIDRPNTIVVMATDPDGHPARAYNGTTKSWEQYSNWGRNHVHIAAPGTMILGIPNVDATSYGDGTSYATPIVTATAAVIMGKHPDWDVATVKRAILESARQVEGLDDLCMTGGVLDIEAAFRWTP